MKDYDFAYDITFIREMLDLSQEEFASELDVSQITMAMWETSKTIPNKSSLEKIYNFAIDKGININQIKTRFFDDDKKDRVLLFHGSNYGINGEISFEFSNPRSDFGIGFYLGENLTQAASWVCDSNYGSVYCFYAKLDSLKIIKFDVDLDWILAVCLNRGFLDEKINHPVIKKLKKRIENADVIFAPIADNVMYLTIQEFANGFITDEQCKHSLNANHLGMQYVFKSEESLEHLQSIARLYLCERERDHYRDIKIAEEVNGQNKSKAARIEYRNKGRYIDEIFK